MSALTRPGEIAARNDVAEVVVELVGAADHVLAAFEGLVDDDGEAVARAACRRASRPTGPEVAGGAVEELLEFRRLHGAQLGRAEHAQQLGFVHLVVAAQEGGDAVPGVRGFPSVPRFSAM